MLPSIMLLLSLLFSLGAACYVIFFRTVVAGEIPEEEIVNDTAFPEPVTGGKR